MAAAHTPLAATDALGRTAGSASDDPPAPTRASGPARTRRDRCADASVSGRGAARPGAPHDALLALDIETVADERLLPPDWDPVEKFPKPAWHRIVAISFVEASIERDADGWERYAVRACRSGGEAGWDEERLLRAFWRFFDRGRYRIVTWNGRAFDVPTILLRSMIYGIPSARWHRAGTKWEGYGSRFACDWHTDVMEAMAHSSYNGRMTLDQAAAMAGFPGKMGEHGSNVGALVAAGEIGRVRDYCETDCLNLFGVYVRWALSTGRTDLAGHDAAMRNLVSYLGEQGPMRPHLGRFLAAWLAACGSRTPFLAGGTESRSPASSG